MISEPRVVALRAGYIEEEVPGARSPGLREMNATIRCHNPRVAGVWVPLAELLVLAAELVLARRPAPTASDRNTAPTIDAEGKRVSSIPQDPDSERHALRGRTLGQWKPSARLAGRANARRTMPPGKAGGRRSTIHAQMSVVMAPA